MNRSHGVCLVVVIVALSLGASAQAQSIWLPRGEGNAVIFEALHTSIEDFEEDFASGTLSLTARIEKDPTTAFVADVTFARLAGDTEDASKTVGNPYIGLEMRLAESPLFAEVGVRIPVTSNSEPARVVGILSDPARIDAFTPEVVAVHLIANVREVSSSGLMTRLRLGPVVTVQDGIGEQTDVLAIFAWQIGLETTSVRIGSAITGSSLLTGTGGLGIGERTSTQFEAHADFGDWSIRPGVDLKLPIGEFASVVDVVLGVSLGATF